MQHFFSYSRKDKDFVTKLFHDLEAQKCDVWLDTLDVEAGAKWDRSIEDALAKAQSLIAILSPAAVQSENVMDEVAYALDEGKLVIPIIIEPCEIPLRLRRLQHIDFTRTTYNKALRILVSRIKENEASPGKHADAQPGSRDTDHPPVKRSFIERFKIPVIIGIVLVALLITWVCIPEKGQPTDPVDIRERSGPVFLGSCDDGGIYYEKNGATLVFKFILTNPESNVAIYSDVNANHQIDYKTDRSYYTVDKDSILTLCTAYMPDDSKCSAPSKAIMTRVNDTIQFSIPLSELSQSPDPKQILIECMVYNSSMLCKLPAEANEDLAKTYSINLP